MLFPLNADNRGQGITRGARKVFSGCISKENSRSAFFTAKLVLLFKIQFDAFCFNVGLGEIFN